MTETEKRHAGEMYYAMDPDIRRDYLESRSVCWRYNQLAPWQEAEREALLKGFLHQTGEHLTIEPPFYCDFGFNVEVGENFFANYNLTNLSGAKVKFCDNVFLGPNCGFYPPEHPHDVESRNAAFEFAFPITVGNNVWMGGGCTVLSGVTIGDNTIIGAGSVVTHDIPANVIAAGNPCRVLRPLTEEEMNGTRHL
ncbi:MAG: sugar O-acetyltransferase [Clostridia bacterium]|nr:sugar O-acetyltransferase [Clostridia bacterium]